MAFRYLIFRALDGELLQDLQSETLLSDRDLFAWHSPSGHKKLITEVKFIGPLSRLESDSKDDGVRAGTMVKLDPVGNIISETIADWNQRTKEEVIAPVLEPI